MISGDLGYGGELMLLRGRYLAVPRGIIPFKEGKIETVDLLTFHEFASAFPDRPDVKGLGWTMKFLASNGRAELTVFAERRAVEELYEQAKDLRSEGRAVLVRDPRNTFCIDYNRFMAVAALICLSVAVIVLWLV